MSRARLSTWLKWALALTALAFVVRAVPFRDRCQAPGSQEWGPLERDAEHCVLHLPTGDRVLSGSECHELTCQPGLKTTLQDASTAPLFAAALVYALGTLFWSMRWRGLLRLAGLELSVSTAWRTILESQAGGILLPGGVAGDALRVSAMVGKGAQASVVIASVLLDRLIGLSTLAFLAGALGLLYGGLPGQMLAFLTAIPSGLLVGCWALRHPPLARWISKSRFTRFARAPIDYIAHPQAPRAMWTATAVSLLVSGVQLGVIRLLLDALHVSPPVPGMIYSGAALSFLASAVPALPGGWGTGDAAFVFFLRPAGVPEAAALAVCLAYRALWYLSGVVGALLFVTKQRQHPPQSVHSNEGAAPNP